MLRIKFVSNPDKWGLSEVKKGGPVDLKGSWHRVKIKIIDGLYYDAMCVYGDIPDDADVVIYVACDEPGTPIKNFKYGEIGEDYELAAFDDSLTEAYMPSKELFRVLPPLSNEAKTFISKIKKKREEL